MNKQRKPQATRIGVLTLIGMGIALSAWSVQSQEPPAPQVQTRGGDRARMILDEEAGVVRIEIDGQEAARIDAEGLHVERHINYGGAITDVGPSGLKTSE